MLPNQLQLYYASSELSVDGESLPIKMVTGDATIRSAFAWSDSSGIDWTYAIGWFDLHTLTPALRGVFFSVRVATAIQITTAISLPDTPVVGDTFRLVQGMRFRSDTAIPFNLVDAYPPEFTTVTLRAITGVTIRQCKSAVDLYVRYDAEALALAISVDGTSWHSALDVSVDMVGEYMQTTTGEWLLVDVDASALPSETIDERVMISELCGSLVPIIWVDSENQDNVLHHFAVLKNTSEDSGDVENVQVQSVTAVGIAIIASDYTDGDPTIELEDIDGLPGRDFWLHLDDSPGDLRYVTQRAGGLCYLADTSGWQEVAFDNGANEPTIGQVIEAGSIAGILRAVYQTGGTWAGGDASGVMIVSGSDGEFGNGETLVQDSLSIADVDGDGEYAIRGIARQSLWAEGETVRWYPPYDILLIDPDSNEEFETAENPQSILILASSFSTWAFATDEYTGVTVASFGSGDIVGVIIRQYLLSDTVGNLQIIEDLSFDWE